MAGMGPRRGDKVNDLNLVPFIDLFSVIIIFLLSTAVMTELSSMKMNLGTPESGAVDVPVQDQKKISSNVKITITADGIDLMEESKHTRSGRVDGHYDLEPIRKAIADIRERNAQKKDMLIVSGDDVRYEDLVNVMDLALERDFSEVVVSGQGG